MIETISFQFVSLLLLALAIALAFWLLRPERGAFWRWQRARKMSERVLREDALKHVHRFERYGRNPSVESLAGALHITGDKAAQLLSNLEVLELLRVDGTTFHLTPRGRDYALHIIRAHRLWERYLADETGFSQELWHDQAELAEHGLSRAAADRLAVELGNPTHDPHGDPIPTATGEMVLHGGLPLTALPLDTPAQIVHLEDEPDAIYAQLVAEGLHPGMVARVVEASPQRLRFWANGEEHLLAPIVAANISVRPLPELHELQSEAGQRLSSLEPGERGEVMQLSQACRGNERRRFLDLGILPGTLITAEMRSPSGDPTAYRIRDALIALRQEQADLIRITKVEDES